MNAVIKKVSSMGEQPELFPIRVCNLKKLDKVRFFGINYQVIRETETHFILGWLAAENENGKWKDSRTLLGKKSQQKIEIYL